MNYIIHQFGNLDEQIHTCILVSHEEDEDRADVEYLRKAKRIGSLDPAFGESETVISDEAIETLVTESKAKIAAAWKKAWESGYRNEYQKLCNLGAEKSVLTQADLDKGWSYFRINDLEQQVKELEAWKTSALDVLNGIDLQKCGGLMGLTIGDKILPNVVPHMEFMGRIRKAQQAVITKLYARLDEAQKVIDAAITVSQVTIYLQTRYPNVNLKIHNLKQAVLRWFKSLDVAGEKS